MMPGITEVGNMLRISVTPVAATSAGFTVGAVEGSFCRRLLVKAASPAETKKAPPMV